MGRGSVGSLLYLACEACEKGPPLPCQRTMVLGQACHAFLALRIRSGQLVNKGRRRGILGNLGIFRKEVVPVVWEGLQ